jgi:hypothetical protein
VQVSYFYLSIPDKCKFLLIIICKLHIYKEWKTKLQSGSTRHLILFIQNKFNASVNSVNAQHKIFLQKYNSLLFLRVVIWNKCRLAVCMSAAGVILTVLFLVRCRWLTSASLPNGFSAQQSRHTVIVPSTQLTLLQPICKQAWPHYCNNRIPRRCFYTAF